MAINWTALGHGATRGAQIGIAMRDQDMREGIIERENMMEDHKLNMQAYDAAQQASGMSHSQFLRTDEGLRLAGNVLRYDPLFARAVGLPGGYNFTEFQKEGNDHVKYALEKAGGPGSWITRTRGKYSEGDPVALHKYNQIEDMLMASAARSNYGPAVSQLAQIHGKSLPEALDHAHTTANDLLKPYDDSPTIPAMVGPGLQGDVVSPTEEFAANETVHKSSIQERKEAEARAAAEGKKPNHGDYPWPTDAGVEIGKDGVVFYDSKGKPTTLTDAVPAASPLGMVRDQDRNFMRRVGNDPTGYAREHGLWALAGQSLGAFFDTFKPGLNEFRKSLGFSEEANPEVIEKAKEANKKLKIKSHSTEVLRQMNGKAEQTEPTPENIDKAGQVLAKQSPDRRLSRPGIEAMLFLEKQGLVSKESIDYMLQTGRRPADDDMYKWAKEMELEKRRVAAYEMSAEANANYSLSKLRDSYSKQTQDMVKHIAYSGASDIDVGLEKNLDKAGLTGKEYAESLVYALMMFDPAAKDMMQRFPGRFQMYLQQFLNEYRDIPAGVFSDPVKRNYHASSFAKFALEKHAKWLEQNPEYNQNLPSFSGAPSQQQQQPPAAKEPPRRTRLGEDYYLAPGLAPSAGGPLRQTPSDPHAIPDSLLSPKAMELLVKSESSGRLDAETESGTYIGKYQMGPDALDDIGMMKNGKWTGKYGINSREEFMRNEAAQDRAMNDYLRVQLGYLRNYGMLEHVGTKFKGVPVTQEGLLLAAHLVGIGGVIEMFKTGNEVYDDNGTSALKYLKMAL